MEWAISTRSITSERDTYSVQRDARMVWYIFVADINQSGIPSPLYFAAPARFVSALAATAGARGQLRPSPGRRVLCLAGLLHASIL